MLSEPGALAEERIVAKECTNCGHKLPENAAHFCANCGMLVDSAPVVPETPHPSLHEQIAQQPANRPSLVPPVHPGWMNTQGREHSAPGLSGYPALPFVEQRPKAAQEGEARFAPAEQEASLAIEDIPTGALPSDLSAIPQESQPPRSEPGQIAIEDLPTRRMPLTPAQRDVLSDRPVSRGKPATSGIEEIAEVDTVTMPASSSASSATPPAPAEKVAQPSEQTPPGPRPEQPPIHSSVIAGAVPAPVTATPPPVRRARRISVLFIVGILGILLLSSGGIWVYLTHPFSVAPVTQPWQSFKSTPLGVSLNYPTSWLTENTGQGGLSLHDSSNTAMFTLSRTPASGNDPAHLLQQQGNKLGITNVKTLAPVTFAGVSWQREEGSVQISSATYTIVLCSGTHGNYVYLAGQSAAQDVYGEYEQSIFAYMRSSFRFL